MDQVTSTPLFAFNLHALPPLITAIAILSLGLFVSLREKASRESLLYLAYTLAASIWMICAAVALFLTSEEMAYQWMKFANAGVAMMPASLYHFTVVVLGAGKQYRQRVTVAWALSTLFLAATLLTDLLFDGFYLYSWGIFLRFRWPSYLFMVYFVVMMAETLRLYWVEYRRSDRNTTKHRRSRAFLIAFSIGYLGSLDFLPALGVPYYPMSSIPMICMLILVSRAIWRYRLVDITPAFAAQEIIDNMRDALIVLDQDKVIRLVNQATTRMLRCRDQDLAGTRPSDGFAAYRELAVRLESLTESDSVRDLEVNCHPQDNTRRSFSLSTSIMRNPVGEAMATVCLISDITDRKLADEDRERLIVQLQDANRKLQSIDNMKTNFITLVSHELRTPLTTIKAFIELLLIKQNIPEAQKIKLMSTVNDEADRLTRLVNELLDLARIEAGSMKWHSEELQLDSLIQSTIALMTPLFEKKELQVTTAFETSSTRIQGDRDRLVQVVTNILSNAAKFTRPGGAVHVSVRRQTEPPSHLAIAISDTGIGIHAADIEAIFDKFHRSDDAHATGIEGTGLGLAIAREIVEYHGGRIWASSEQGKGSVFTFTLPQAKSGTEACSPAQS